MLSWLSRTTLDIIGLCGFNYSFDAVSQGEEASELSASFSQMFKGTQQDALSNLFRILRTFIPILCCLVRFSRLSSIPFIGSSRLLRRTSWIPRPVLRLRPNVPCVRSAWVWFKESSALLWKSGRLVEKPPRIKGRSEICSAS